MALMSKEEQDKLFKRAGIVVKRKCDFCGSPIVGCLTYGGEKGEYCTRPCLEEAEPRGKSSKKDRDQMSIKNKNDEEEEPKKKKKKRDEDDDEEPKKKKKKSEDDEDDDEPKKKKKKSSDDDDDEPKKKKAKKDDEEKPSAPKGNPFRGGSAMAEAFELGRAGTTRKQLIKFCEKQQIGSARIFGVLKKNEYGNQRWRYAEDEDGNITVKLKKKE